jgi:adenylosuccinate lyase
MIDRYTSSFFKSLWNDQSKFNAYLAVEFASIDILLKRGIIDSKTHTLLKKATFNLSAIETYESQLHHDLLAFIASCHDQLGEEKRFFHFGLTSSDVIDTAHGLLLKQANQAINKSIEALLVLLQEKAYAYQDTLMMARTHGMYAEVTTYGLRYALWYDDLRRLFSQFKSASTLVEICKLSGSIGNYPLLPEDHESAVASLLGLNTDAIHTQVIQRDRHSSYISSLVNIACFIEKIALDIRLLSRSDVMEVSEGFSATQKGSSAMPHKKNPINAENLTGLARLMRGYLASTFENQTLWHERDISHSSVERIVLMDATSLLDTMLTKITKTLTNLTVYSAHMLAHVEQSYDTGSSQFIMHKAIIHGVDRDLMYKTLQGLSFQAIETKTSLLTLVQKDPHFAWLDVSELNTSLLAKRQTSVMLKRVFKK